MPDHDHDLVGFQGQAGQQAPDMPDDFVKMVSERYIELYNHITGEQFDYADVSNVLDRVENNIRGFLKETYPAI